MWLFACILAVVWGGIWAAFLQYVPLGQFLARKRTWITVVIGIGVDMLIALAVVPWDVWLQVVMLIALSAVAIVFRSIVNEWQELREEMDGYQDSTGQ